MPTPNANDEPLPDFMKDLGLPQPVDSPRRRHGRAAARARRAPAYGARPPAPARDDGADGDQPARRHRRRHQREGALPARHRRQGGPRRSQTSSFTRHRRRGTRRSTAAGSARRRRRTRRRTSRSRRRRASASQAEVDLHTKLSGEVNVRFKSETFPLDKMADIIGVDKIGNQQVGTGKNLQSQPPATASAAATAAAAAPEHALPGVWAPRRRGRDDDAGRHRRSSDGLALAAAAVGPHAAAGVPAGDDPLRLDLPALGPGIRASCRTRSDGARLRLAVPRGGARAGGRRPDRGAARASSATRST